MSLNFWNLFWFSPMDPAVLKRFRIFSGLYLVMFYVMVFSHWNDWFQSSGILSGRFFPWNDYSLFSWLEPTGTIFPLWCLGFATGILYLFGIKTKIMTVILFLLQLSMVHRNPMVIGGGDFVMLPMLFYFIFASPRGEIWPLRMMQLQICLIYWLTLFGKVSGHESWVSGEFMYHFLINPMWSHWPLPGILYYKAVTVFMTWSVLLFQLSFPLLIWVKKTRRPVLLIALLFHLTIAVFVKQVFFLSFAMIICLTLFMDKLDLTLFSKEEI